MSVWAKSLAKGLASAGGAYLTPATPPDALRDLLRRLRPRQSEDPLVRVGPDHDGGYLIPDCLGRIRHAFSPGVSDEVGFDLELAERGIVVFLADASVDGSAINHTNLKFTPRFLGAVSEGNTISLDDWIEGAIEGESRDLLLQMDIEGGEYATLLGASSRTLARFEVMVVEFHNLDKLFSRPFFDLASAVFQKLLQNHDVVHIHPNNCGLPVKRRGIRIPPVAEFTFQRRAGSERRYRSDFPHPMDAPNTPRGDVPLPPEWYGP